MEKSREELDRIAELFKTLGDVTRIQILYGLEDEKCVSELARELDMTHSAVSHQLSVLKINRLVNKSRKGKQIYYQLSDDSIKSLLKMGENYACSR